MDDRTPVEPGQIPMSEEAGMRMVKWESHGYLQYCY